MKIFCTETSEGIECRVKENAFLRLCTAVGVGVVVFVLLCALALALRACRIGGEPAVDEVEDAAAYDAVVAKGEPVLAVVTAPWCTHCKQFLPRFREAAEELRREGVAVRMAAIDGERFSGIHRKVRLPGYPTCVAVLPDGTVKPVKPVERTKDAVKELGREIARAVPRRDF